MNKKRRECLRKAISYLDKAAEIVDDTMDQEQDCIDNMPENLQMSEKVETMENAVSYLEDAASPISEVRDRVEAAM